MKFLRGQLLLPVGNRRGIARRCSRGIGAGRVRLSKVQVLDERRKLVECDLRALADPAYALDVVAEDVHPLIFEEDEYRFERNADVRGSISEEEKIEYRFREKREFPRIVLFHDLIVDPDKHRTELLRADVPCSAALHHLLDERPEIRIIHRAVEF